MFNILFYWEKLMEPFPDDKDVNVIRCHQIYHWVNSGFYRLRDQ